MPVGGAVAQHDGLVEAGAEPPHRPGEPEPAGLPLHRLGERERVEDRREPLGERLARHLDAEEAVPLLQLVGGDAVALRESGGGLLAQRDGRALDPFGRRLAGHVLDEHGKPPRPDEELRGLGAEVLQAERRQLLLRLPAGRGGELLAADLKQQRRHPPPPARRTAA